jgi:NAD(P)-dependent dehydrogenase (short-subunit alcohol dehydrogenase family)
MPTPATPAAGTWFITGTSSGFGRQLTKRLLEHGCRVAATLRRPEALDDLLSAHPRLWVARLDVTDTQQIRDVVADAFAALGSIDVVVSNAGYALLGAAEECTDDQIARQIHTNVLGSIQLVRAVLPHLRAQGGGRILQLSSMGGQVAFPGLSLYHATKWAVEGFFESLGPEVAPFGIETCLVEPGGARTDFGARSLQIAPANEAYADTPAGSVRAYAATRSDAGVPGDPAKMANAMIRAAGAEILPKRLLLGSDCYRLVGEALTDRLEQVEACRDVALSTDADDYVSAGGPLRG